MRCVLDAIIENARNDSRRVWANRFWWFKIGRFIFTNFIERKRRWIERNWRTRKESRLFDHEFNDYSTIKSILNSMNMIARSVKNRDKELSDKNVFK